MNIGERIIYFREILGMTQNDLAKKSGLTASAICQYETTKRLPDLKSFIKLCNGLGVKMEKFLEGVEVDEK